ncbi:DGQHR domain-containing protein [Acidobacteriota bacterium]
MKIKALKMVQNNQTLFVLSMKAQELIDLGVVDEWKPDVNELGLEINELLGKQGYQRSPIRSHYTKVGKYLADYKDALLPTAILMNSREKLNFVPENGSESEGVIEFPKQNSLYIVDGQHRIYGIKYAMDELGLKEIATYPLPVIIIDQVSKEDEVRHFFLVNSTQKKVRTDLAERLLSLLARKDPRVLKDLKEKERAWKIRAIKVVDVLSRESDSPWFGRIKRPNQQSSPDAVASEGSFTTSLKPVLSNEFVANESDEVVIGWLKAYWDVMKDLMPEVFEEPRKYVIQKTPGMYTLHMIYPYIHYECTKSGDHSKKKIKEILSRDTEHFLEGEFWASGGDGAALYNSAGAFRILAAEIKDRLKGV